MDAEEVLSRINQAALKEAPELDLSGLGLKSLPPQVWNLTNLTFLNIEHNELTELPSEIGYLTNLTGLVLADNQLIGLPPEIVKLTQLDLLWLSGSAGSGDIRPRNSDVLESKWKPVNQTGPRDSQAHQAADP